MPLQFKHRQILFSKQTFEASRAFLLYLPNFLSTLSLKCDRKPVFLPIVNIVLIAQPNHANYSHINYQRTFVKVFGLRAEQTGIVVNAVHLDLTLESQGFIASSSAFICDSICRSRSFSFLAVIVALGAAIARSAPLSE